jgi:hypothetical protein
MRTPAKRIAPVAAKGLELAGRLKQVRLSVQAGHSSAFRRPRGLAAPRLTWLYGVGDAEVAKCADAADRRFDEVTRL